MLGERRTVVCRLNGQRAVVVKVVPVGRGDRSGAFFLNREPVFANLEQPPPSVNPFDPGGGDDDVTKYSKNIVNLIMEVRGNHPFEEQAALREKLMEACLEEPDDFMTDYLGGRGN